MGEIKKRLGEILIDEGIIDELQLSSALGNQKQWGGRLASILINMGIDEKSICSVLEKKLGQECISPENRKIPPEALKMVKYEVAVKYSILPVNFDKKTLTIAMSDPTDLKIIDELSFVLGTKIKPVLALESKINDAIANCYKEITPHGGKKHVIVINNLPEKMEITSNESIEPEKSFPPEIVSEAVADILIEKGIITRAELTDKIVKKLRQSQPLNKP